LGEDGIKDVGGGYGECDEENAERGDVLEEMGRYSYIFSAVKRLLLTLASASPH